MNPHVYADLLHKSIIENASRPCMHIKRNGEYLTWTYADFHRDLNRLVSAVRKHGFSDNDNLVVIGDNTPEWVMAWHAGFLAGGRTAPVDPNLPAPEIREIVSRTRPKFVFCSKNFAALFEDMKLEFDYLSCVVADDERHHEKNATFGAFLLSGNPNEDVFSRTFSPDDPTVIIFTSGTTGKAKGVVLCQRNFTAISLSAIPRMHVGPGDTMMAVLPLHHVFGACACLPGALGGGLDIVLIPTVKGSLIMDGLREKKVSMLPAVPKMLQLFYNSINQNVKSKGIAVRMMFAVLKFISFTLGRCAGQKFRARLFSAVHRSFGGRLSIIISGGASIQKNIFNGFLLMGFNIVEGYGLSETFGAITLCPLEKPKLSSVGVPLAENEVKIDKPDASGIGEVCFRGTNVFPGYYNNAERTKEVFDAGGWFHTGDLGRVDNDGFVFLSGRIKDIIVLDSGKNVYPDELEDFYASSQSIDEIGVFSATLKGKEIAAALIVPSPNIRRQYPVTEATEMVRNEVLRLGRDLPSYKKITDFAVVYDSLPRTTSKKLKKHELRELYYALKESGGGERIKQVISAVENNLMATEEYRALTSFAAKLANKNEHASMPPFFHLELDLGLDSMKRLDLLCMAERYFRVVFPDEDLVKIETLGDVYTTTLDLLSGSSSTGCAETLEDIKQRIVCSKLPVPYPPKTAAAAGVVPLIASVAIRKLWNVSATGADDLPGVKPMLFCANRQSPLDPLWVIYSLPYALRRKTYLISGKGLAPRPLLAAMGGNIVHVKNEGDVANILKLSISILSDGNNLLVFPESSPTRTGELRKFKSGVGLLMLDINAAVVPVRIRGTFDVWPLGGLPRLFAEKKTPPTITFGMPLTFQSLIEAAKITPYSTADQIAACLREIISEM